MLEFKSAGRRILFSGWHSPDSNAIYFMHEDEFLGWAYHLQKGVLFLILCIFYAVGPLQSEKYRMCVP